MHNSLDALEDWAGVLLQKLEPQARNALARTVGQQLRRSQQQRVTAQRNPDGSRYTPRNLRSKKGRVRNKAKMFHKLRTARYLKAKGDSNAVSVGFTGRIARIARVHQLGLRDRAERGAPDVRYARRQVLGFTEADLELVRTTLIDHLTL
jgi:phage virion morphogenesis protein